MFPTWEGNVISDKESKIDDSTDKALNNHEDDVKKAVCEDDHRSDWGMDTTQTAESTGCSEETVYYKFVTALVVYHLESYRISAFFTDNGTF